MTVLSILVYHSGMPRYLPLAAWRDAGFAVRHDLTTAIEREFVPVRHTLGIEALNDGETAESGPHCHRY